MSKKTLTARSSPKGVVLLLVLGIIMAITILSLGFIARCDTELASGRNMATRMQMDQLAASALEHGRGLLLNPQEVDGDFWAGGTALRLDPNTNDFYDVNVAADPTDPNDFCTYEITSTAYREKDGQRTAESRFEATLRLDPAVALWSGADLYVRDGWGIVGDVYVYTPGILTNPGLSSAVNGDVFAAGLSGDIVGTDTNSVPLGWPPVTSSYSHPDYTTSSIGPGTVSGSGSYDSPNIWRCSGDLTLDGSVVVNGMLLVEGDLIIEGSGARLTAAKNLPAVYVTGNLILRGATDLRIEGLVAVDGKVLAGRGTDVQIVGGLFAGGEIAEATVDSSVYANGAILRNIPTWSGSGVLALDGVNQYVQTPDDSTSLQLTGEYTLSVRLRTEGTQKVWAGIICKADPTGSTNHWVLQFDNSSTRKLVVCHGSRKWDTGITLPDIAGPWRQVAVVRRADGTMLSYFDGVLRKTLNPGVGDELLFKNTAPGSGLGHLNIGADRTGWPTYVYKGLLDDVRVYNRALTAVEVAAPPTDASLIGHWTFDATSGSQVHVTADPIKAAIAIGPAESRVHWSPAAGAFFKSVRRPDP